MTVKALTKAMDMARALSGMSHQLTMEKASAAMADRIALSSSLDPGDWQAQARNRENYSMFRSWVYAAINAIASEAAGQPVSVAKLSKKESKSKRQLVGVKRQMVTNTMTKTVRHKVMGQNSKELEVIEDHWLIDLMERPNPVQYRFQFVYSFVANLALTGRAYIVMDDDGEGNPEYFSLPTTWVRPNKDGSKFYVNDPRMTSFDVNQEPLDASQVAMAYLPNPADPKGCFAPASSQGAAVQIDDKIQTCQVKFFDNGPFPSMIVTIGKDPHPDVPGGVRPRLTATQRRQVTGAIKRVMGGVANYGAPAIVDGLIESISRLTPAQNEIGWEKSEDAVKKRILSAFCVHPFILGEAVSIGGYAQVFVIKERFYERVNIYLDLLSTVMTEFTNRDDRQDNDNLLIWWEALKATDPSMEKSAWESARQRRDVTPNEWRGFQGLPPQDGGDEWSITTDGMANSVITLMEKVGGGTIQRDQAQAILVHMGVPEDHAENILGEEPEEPEPAPMPPGLVPGQPGQVPGQSGVPGQQPPPGKPPKTPKPPKPGEENPVEEATEELKRAVALLKTPADQLVSSIAGSLGLE